MNKRISLSELTRLAFIYAEQDRLSFAECQPKGSVEEKEAYDLAAKFNRYRMKRWGKTQFEADIANSTLVDVYTLLREK